MCWNAGRENMDGSGYGSGFGGYFSDYVAPKKFLAAPVPASAPTLCKICRIRRLRLRLRLGSASLLVVPVHPVHPPCSLGPRLYLQDVSSAADVQRKKSVCCI